MTDELRFGICYDTNHTLCHKFTFDVLLSHNIYALDNWLAQINNLDFFKHHTHSIHNIQPILALSILKKFSVFKIVSSDPLTHTTVQSVETIEHWIQNYTHRNIIHSQLQRVLNLQDKHVLISYLEQLALVVRNHNLIDKLLS